jgi:two-component system, NarL family, nitrate/nitrite response regulator NarL
MLEANPPSGRVRVLVVDDHRVVLEGVALLVKSDPTIAVVGDARSADEAIRVARRVRPDVILLDLRLPDMLATEAVPLLRMAAPQARILLFTAYAGHAAVKAAIDAGVDGCLLKDVSDTELVDAVKRIARGVRMMDPRLAKDTLPGRQKKVPAPSLTRREYGVLRRVAMGETNPEIAEAMGLSRNTVKAYVQTTLQKLGARNRVEAITRAQEFGLL